MEVLYHRRGEMSSLYPANICRGLFEIVLVIIEEIGTMSEGKLGENFRLVLGNIEATISNREDVLREDVMISQKLLDCSPDD